MDPIWEYRWEFFEDGYWGGMKQTSFWMTDIEAARWHAFGKPQTRRLDETKRDRNTVKIDYNATSTGFHQMREK
ncbi:hypothetical protein FAZ95_13685 [Trinickia violacea]|uniref:Uncharacterized protein n=1 Tax=Trinickia violacea TaxID=2571746 RepID=A0A4P8ISY0_9BURK|nr:hypothetical protein [Trinickia violacea]QCP50134.1 hypothetical protein FAZ95_13685 [Trinickia violacea]